MVCSRCSLLTTRAMIVDPEAACAALAAADVDVVTEDGRLASSEPRSVVDASHPEVDSTESTDGLKTRVPFCLRREAARDRSDDIRSEGVFSSCRTRTRRWRDSRSTVAKSRGRQG